VNFVNLVRVSYFIHIRHVTFLLAFDFLAYFLFEKGRHIFLIALFFIFSLQYFSIFLPSHSIFYAKQHHTELVKTFVIQIPCHKMWEASLLVSYKSRGPLPFILLESSISRPPSALTHSCKLAIREVPSLVATRYKGLVY
jgi:hypothetical protein